MEPAPLRAAWVPNSGTSVPVVLVLMWLVTFLVIITFVLGLLI